MEEKHKVIQRGRPSTAGRLAATSTFKTKAPALLTKQILGSTPSTQSSPKGQAAKQKLNINSSPVIVKKKI